MPNTILSPKVVGRGKGFIYLFIEIIKIDLNYFCYRICLTAYDSFEEEMYVDRITSEINKYTLPEQALSAGIDKCIKILKEKQYGSEK